MLIQYIFESEKVEVKCKMSAVKNMKICSRKERDNKLTTQYYNNITLIGKYFNLLQ